VQVPVAVVELEVLVDDVLTVLDLVEAETVEVLDVLMLVDDDLVELVLVVVLEEEVEEVVTVEPVIVPWA
jgi:hypothetical protein